MSRAPRLLALLDELRRHRHPVTAAALATRLEVSERTIYRDIASLIGQGADIAGEAGIGYVLRPGFLLPPLMFDAEELEALVLGLRLVAAQADDQLAEAAWLARGKISAVLPAQLRATSEDIGLLAGHTGAAMQPGVDAALLRQAVREEHKLRLTYVDRDGLPSQRIVWPIAIGFFTASQVLAAWCELRGGFRHFRLDRIASAVRLPDRLPRRRATLLRQWRAAEGIDHDDADRS